MLEAHRYNYSSLNQFSTKLGGNKITDKLTKIKDAKIIRAPYVNITGKQNLGSPCIKINV